MDKEFISEVKKKREFSKLPDSIVVRVANKTESVKEARALLRKYFGVFLTNKVRKGKGTADEILQAHISSKKRDYSKFYERLSESVGNEFNFILDFGAGVNGYSYNYFKKIFGNITYFAIEASGQLVENMNSFFDKNNFNGNAICADLMELEVIKETFDKVKSGKKLIFLFQVIDALESLDRNFSKIFLMNLREFLTEEDRILISLPVESLSGRKNFAVRRKWFVDFLEEEFIITDDFLMDGERFFCIRKN